MIETKSSLRPSWYDYNWDWVLISLLALVILAGIVLWITYADHSQTAAIPMSLLQDRTPDRTPDLTLRLASVQYCYLYSRIRDNPSLCLRVQRATLYARAS